jgi:hypothetical protein
VSTVWRRVTLAPRKALVATLSSGAFDAIPEVVVLRPLVWVGEYDLAAELEDRVGDGSSVKFGAIVGLAFVDGFGMSESDA